VVIAIFVDLVDDFVGHSFYGTLALLLGFGLGP
jgi:hypothetical protein